jgi:hypothetical protein
MSCQLCGSGNETELAAEMIIHFSGLRNLDKPGVWVFSKLLVCLDCGCSHFTRRGIWCLSRTLWKANLLRWSRVPDEVMLSSGVAYVVSRQDAFQFVSLSPDPQTQLR